ncbi:MAG: hypothetical protein IBX50_08575 [Marinospirillum sp.]|nr:hypothetical protein [Marinospirillum sp.]
MNPIENSQLIPNEAIIENTSLKATSVMVTPAIASKWLSECNTANRPVTAAHVERLKNEILKEKWSLNGASICFNNQNVIVDGQHRLHAIIAADATIPCLVITGIEDPEAFRSHGLSKPRTAADMAAIKGVKNHHEMASIARFMIMWESSKNGSEFASEMLYSKYSDVSSPDDISTKAMEISTDAGQVLDMCRDALWLKRRTKWIAALLVIYLADKDRATIFINDLVNGNKRYGDSTYPVFMLRDKLMTGVEKNNSAQSNLIAAAYIFKAWNSFIQGKTIKNLKYSQGRDVFPIPFGTK